MSSPKFTQNDLSRISTAAKQYRDNLLDKEISFLSIKDGKIFSLDTKFYDYNFIHLIGLKRNKFEYQSKCHSTKTK